MGCVAIGAMFSLPVFLQPIVAGYRLVVTGVSAAMTIGFLAMACGSIGWGALTDRIGPRPVVLAGRPSCWRRPGAGQPGADRCSSSNCRSACWSAVATAAIFAPMMATVTGWFDTHRSLAVSLVSAGMGVAPMTMAPLAAWLVSNHDWRTSMLIDRRGRGRAS